MASAACPAGTPGRDGMHTHFNHFMVDSTESLNDYIEAHIGPEDPLLRDLYRHTHLTRLYPRMCTDHVQGSVLSMLTAMIRPHHIVELGTFSGYSTICFAQAMPEQCIIDTIEIDDEHADELRELFDSTGYGGRIRLHIADALDVLDDILDAGDVDMVFVDADKRSYLQYYTAMMRHLCPGAFILADNTLWDGKVSDPAAHDAQTEGIRAFNDAVAADTRVRRAILPLRDGLTLIQVL